MNYFKLFFGFQFLFLFVTPSLTHYYSNKNPRSFVYSFFAINLFSLGKYLGKDTGVIEPIEFDPIPLRTNDAPIFMGV